MGCRSLFGSYYCKRAIFEIRKRIWVYVALRNNKEGMT